MKSADFSKLHRLYLNPIKPSFLITLNFRYSRQKITKSLLHILRCDAIEPSCLMFGKTRHVVRISSESESVVSYVIVLC